MKTNDNESNFLKAARENNDALPIGKHQFR